MVKAKEEVLKDPVLQKIVEVIVKEIDPDKIILFGSRARGDYDEYSDYDILVLKEGIRPEERFSLMWRLKRVVSGYVDGIYDIIVQDTEKYVLLSRDPFTIYASAEKEGVVLYEKGKGEGVA